MAIRDKTTCVIPFAAANYSKLERNFYNTEKKNQLNELEYSRVGDCVSIFIKHRDAIDEF